MPTYNSSPQKTDLLEYIFRAEDLDHAGVIDSIGTAGRVHVFDSDNQSAGAAWFGAWDGVVVDWDAPELLLYVPSATHHVIHVSTGLLFSTAITSAQTDSFTNPPTPASVVGYDFGTFTVPLT